MSEWVVKESFWMNFLGYHFQTLRRMGTQNYIVEMRRHLMDAVPGETKKNKKIRRNVSKLFTCDAPAEEEYKYKQSIAVAEHFLIGSSLPQKPGYPRINKLAGIV
jgi:hypothetical protein